MVVSEKLCWISSSIVFNSNLSIFLSAENICPPILILQWGLLVIIELKKIENQFRLIFSSLTAINFFSIVYLVLFTELNFLTCFLFQYKNFM